MVDETNRTKLTRNYKTPRWFNNPQFLVKYGHEIVNEIASKNAQNNRMTLCNCLHLVSFHLGLKLTLGKVSREIDEYNLFP